MLHLLSSHLQDLRIRLCVNLRLFMLLLSVLVGFQLERLVDLAIMGLREGVESVLFATVSILDYALSLQAMSTHNSHSGLENQEGAFVNHVTGLPRQNL